MKDKLTLKRLHEILSTDFGEPFLPKGTVTSKLSKDEKRLTITIGNRDVELTDSGEITGSGTFLI